MSYLEETIKKYRSGALPNKTQPKLQVSEKVLSLVQQLTEWHNKRPVPDRWHPVILGRLAATFGVTNEVMAATLHYAGWKETKKSTYSLWVAPIK